MVGEARETGKIAPTAHAVAQPYRRHLVGLPLQRSLVSEAARAATALGFPGISSARDFPARLDENGDLFLDRSRVAALTKALASSFTPKTLSLMHATHAAACDALVVATKDSARVASSLDSAVARKSIEELAQKMAAVLAYGVLGKFVPDVLLRALAEAGDLAPPPFPTKSAGAELMQETYALFKACGDLGYAPERLQQQWPHVSPDVSQLVRQFCQGATGFGPLAWDSPGYEDPTYVTRLLCSAFHEIDPEQLSRRFSSAGKRAVAHSDTDSPAQIAALRRVLGFWLEFLERETWYVRRAFYLGMVPLLQQLAAGYREKLPALAVVDTVFLDIGELTAGVVNPAVISARRHSYLANTEYLSLHAVDLARFGMMLEEGIGAGLPQGRGR